ncbi:hypothetical protein [Lysobacter sp. CA196]|uniref:hypothetical protein n=1 Tax=Lysobacter sp. CA196 TaxID=3455606 RepID=UPI003F8D3BDF
MSNYRNTILSFAMAAVALAPVLAAAQDATAKRVADFIECKLSLEQVNAFGDEINAEQVKGLAQSDDGGDAALMLWKSAQPLSAWGEKSSYVNFPSRQEMHLAYKVPAGQELKLGEALAKRIGGMSPRPDLAAMIETYDWKGLDYRKVLPGEKTVRVLVDVSYAPGWVTVGCGYGDAIQ